MKYHSLTKLYAIMHDLSLIMETKKQKLERLILDEMNTVKLLRDKKKDIERQIDSIADKISEMRDELNAL